MVEVVRLEEYEDFKKTMERELKTLSEKMEEETMRLEAVNKELEAVNKELEAVNKELEAKIKRVNAELKDSSNVLNSRIDRVEESSKSVVVRLREALTAKPKEESDETEVQP